MPNVAVYIVAVSALFFVTSTVVLVVRSRRSVAVVSQELARHRRPERPEPSPETDPQEPEEPDGASDEPEEPEEPANRPVKHPVVVPAPADIFTRRADTAMRKLGFDMTSPDRTELPAVAQMEPSLLEGGAERSLEAGQPEPHEPQQTHKRAPEPRNDAWIPAPRDHTDDNAAGDKTDAERRASLLNLGR